MEGGWKRMWFKVGEKNCSMFKYYGTESLGRKKGGAEDREELLIIMGSDAGVEELS